MKIMERYGTVLRCYDNGGNTADRYTIIPPRWAHEYTQDDLYNGRLFNSIGCNAAPFHPQGIGMHLLSAPGPHLGRRVHWSTLPADVQRFARQAFPEYAP